MVSKTSLCLVVTIALLGLSRSSRAGETPRLLQHRAGASCFRPSDSFYRIDRKWASHLPNRPFLLGAHGLPGKLEEVDYQSVVPRVLERMKRSSHVFLHVCDAGRRGPNGELAVAHRVARDSGRPVVAAMGSIMGNPIRRHGRQELVQIVVRTDNGVADLLPEAKAWRVFYPDGHSKPLNPDRYFRRVLGPPEPAGAGLKRGPRAAPR